MYISLKTKTCFTIVALLIGGLISACASPAIPPTPPDEPPDQSEIITTSSDNLSTSQAPDESVGSLDRVYVVYFHRPQRCPTCLCFEERVRYVVSTYFQNEIDSGQMTLGSITSETARTPILLTNTVLLAHNCLSIP